MKYLKYNDPIQIKWRAGTDEDPYINTVQQITVINGRAVLSEIPDPYSYVIINGYKEIFKDANGNIGIPNSDEYYVDYSTGYIYFNPDQNGKTLIAAYFSRGLPLYPAERIYVHAPNPYAVENLQEFIELAMQKIAEVNNVIGDARQAIENANNAANQAIQSAGNANQAASDAIDAANNANQAADEARQATADAIQATNDAIAETELMHNDRLSLRIIYKEPVQHYGDLVIIYPEPEVGWRVQVLDDGNVYRWDGAKWQFIQNVQGTVVKATEHTDGLLSKEDYVKLQNLEVLDDRYKKRIIVFILPDEITESSQSPIIKFPFDGILTKVSALCGTPGTTLTEITVEKISESDFQSGANTWIGVLESNLFLDYGSYVDDGTAKFTNINVDANDYFRIRLLSIGNGLKDLTVEIEIQI